jgi:peptide deformylase
MAILNILEYPDPRFRTKAEPVAAVDEELRRLAADMLETMYAAPGHWPCGNPGQYSSSHAGR